MAHFDLDPARWKTLDRLLDEALDLPEGERATWARNLPPEHADLREKLLDLLARMTSGTNDGELPPLRGLGGAVRDAGLDRSIGESDAVGDGVGSYRLLRPLGRGGMGTVWLAERTDGLVDRPVALKLPRGDWLRPDLASRMARERRILASLEHPNIARLYDAGFTSDGRPYLALEYVEGMRIDDYCRDRVRDLGDVLRLFVQVLRAVAHAHRRLVVHRDLKPSNILVTQSGDVRLLDFGVAGLLGADDAVETSELTRVSGRMLTVHYASPEQILGGPLGTGSDVYSLGVILFELITGRRPYQPRGDTVRALEESVLNEDAPLPSTMAQRVPWRRALKGDLDRIVLAALKKAPEERYVSTEAFARDIEAYLAGRPVSAQPDSAWYRVSKFVRRNRVAVSAASVTFVAVVAGAGVASWQAVVARAEQRRAEEVTNFISSVFRDADPYGALGRAPSAVELLALAREKIDRNLVDRPELRIELLGIVGWSQFNLQDVDGAESAARAAVEEGRRLLAPDDSRFLRALALRIQVDRLRARLDDVRNGLAEATPLLRNAIRSRPELAEDYVSVLKLHVHLALDEGRFSEAEEAAREGSERVRSLLGPLHSETASMEMLVALACQYQGKAEAALVAARESVRIAEQLDPGNPRHPQAIEARMVMGRALRSMGRLEEGAGEMRRALDGATEVFGPTNMMIGFFAQVLAGCLLDLGAVRDAAVYAQRAVEVIEGNVEPNSFTYGATLGTRGRAWLAARRADLALDDLSRAAGIMEAAHGAGHERTLSARRSHALALAELQRFDEAEAILVAARDASAGATDRARTAGAMARVVRMTGRADEAVRLAREALEHLRAVPDARRECALLTMEWGLAAEDSGDVEAAIRHLQVGLAEWRAMGMRTTPDTAEALAVLSRLFWDDGRTDAALEAAEAVDAFWSTFDPDGVDARAAADAVARYRRVVR
jgi:serine/threonine-protein kinase